MTKSLAISHACREAEQARTTIVVLRDLYSENPPALAFGYAPQGAESLLFPRHHVIGYAQPDGTYRPANLGT